MNIMKRRHFFLIQLMLWIAILLVSGHSWAATPQKAVQTSATTQQVQSVQALEDSLFGIRYDQEPIQSRLDRLEGITFGQTRSDKSVEYRIRYLKDTIAENSQKPLNTSTTAGQPQNNYAPTLNPPPQQQAYQQGYETPPADVTDYPTVTAMEKKVFNRAFTNESVENRLTRLEMQVFRTKQNGALSDRMDNLKLVVLGDTGNPATAASPDPYGNDPYAGQQGGYQQQQYPAPTAYNQPQYQQVPQNYQQGNPYPQQTQNGYPNPYPQGGSNAPVSPDMLQAMNEVESNVLGHQYPAEPFESRMNRVETKVFGNTSPEMSNEDRLQRVIAVASAGGAPQTAKSRAKSTMSTLLPIILTILPMLLL